MNSLTALAVLLPLVLALLAAPAALLVMQSPICAI